MGGLAGVRLAVGGGAVAAVESAVTAPGRRFEEALLSCNLEIPEGCGARLDVRVGAIGGAGAEWSPWMLVAGWGAPIGEPPGQIWREGERELARVDVDYVRAARAGGPLDLLQYRVVAGGDSAGTVTVRRVDVSFSAASPIEGWRAARMPAGGQASPGWEGELDVPFRSQKTEHADLAGRICSPTSVAMVLAFRGVDRPVSEVAARAYDEPNEIYGNWPRNVQAAFAMGVPGYLTRLDEWGEVEALLRQGQPIIASIQVEPGELPGAPYEGTDGHLIVIRGLIRDGVIVNDPAVSTAEAGRLVYRRADVTRVWMERTGGTAYVLLPRDGAGR